MKFGFTGTRAGMTEKQNRACVSIFENFHGKEIHHGDCVGSDYEIHQAFIYRPIDIVVHPPIVDKFRANCSGRIITMSKTDSGTGEQNTASKSVTWRTAKSYFARNRDIVEETDAMIAAPLTEEEKGGTWYTINYARQLKRHIFIVLPNGTFVEENGV
ncbi:MAG: hypothetical protein IH795_11965 [Bacteroidetes bacterium]|nr:hypothetical protein [Bacteroidota bacterium]